MEVGWLAQQPFANSNLQHPTTNMKTFSGFPDSELKMSALPEMFFTDLLPLIDDVLELKVTLACFRLFEQKTGLVLWTTVTELLNDPALADVKSSFGTGVLRAIQRGSIVGAKDRSGLQYLFPNSERGRAAAQAIERGEKIEVIAQTPTRPNIFMLYEQNIGALTPLIADQLRDAEQEFPPQWIEEAFAEAVKQNARSWAYVKKILDRRASGAKRETTGRDIAADWQRAIQKDKRPRSSPQRQPRTRVRNLRRAGLDQRQRADGASAVRQAAAVPASSGRDDSIGRAAAAP